MPKTNEQTCKPNIQGKVPGVALLTQFAVLSIIFQIHY